MSRRIPGRSRASAVLLAVGLAIAVAVAGCDAADPEGASAGSGSGPASGKPKATVPTDMVSAVSANRSTGLVDLKFLLEKHPKVGEAVTIDFALTPQVELQRLFARFQAAEGLQLVSGGETGQIEHPARGVAVDHRVTFVAKADGIFYITAVVVADSEKESIARTFTIPLIAGDGLQELPAAPPAASVAEPQRAPATP